MNPKRMIAVAAACLLAFGPALLAQRGYNYHSLQVKDELGRVVTDLTSVQICTSGSTAAQTIYLEASLTNAVTNPITTSSGNTTLTQGTGSCYWYGTDLYDVTLVSTTYGTIHLKGYSSATSTVIIPTYWSASQSGTHTDAQSETFGSDSDWVIAAGATADRLTMTPATDGATLYLGSTDRQADIYFWQAAATCMWWDESAGTLKFVGTEALFDDDSQLQFGSGADLYFKYAGGTNVLNIGQTATDTGSITVGADGSGIDVTFYGEEVGDYLKWDATGASKLLLVGADSSGTLFGITGIDTTGNTDTMTIAHSGSGDALQITCTEADSVALNLIAATSQTTSVLKVDGATGSWIGADGKGMVNLTNDGALAHVNSSLLFIDNDGVPQNDARGTCIRIDDDGNASAGTAGYSVYISTTDATMEAIYVDDGKVKVDETIEVGGSINGLGTAEIVGMLADFELFTDDDTLLAAESGKTCVADGNTPAAGNIILTLPAASAGLTFTVVDANSTAGDDVYIKAGSGDTINGGTAAQYLACKADATAWPQAVTLVAIDETRWISTMMVGTWEADDTPD